MSDAIYATTLPRPFPDGTAASSQGKPTWPPADGHEDHLNPAKVDRDTFGPADGQRSQMNPVYTAQPKSTHTGKGQRPNVAVISIPLQDHPRRTKYPRPPTPPPILKAKKGKSGSGPFPWTRGVQDEFREGPPVSMTNGRVLQTETDVDTLKLPPSKNDSSNGKRKNVSWNERVQFQAETASDLGVPDKGGETEGDYVNIKLVRQVEGEERLQEPNGRLPQPLPRQPVPDTDTETSPSKQGANPQFRTYMLVAVILLIFAIGGLLALGTLYAIKYIESDDDASDVSALKSRMQWRNDSTVPSPFRSALHSESHGIITYLAESGDYMTWFQPSAVVNMMWHRGSTLKIYSLSSGFDSTTLGDPVQTPGASFSLGLDTATWYAGELLDSDGYCVISISKTTDGSLSYLAGNTDGLLRKYSDTEIQNLIRQIARDG